MIQRRVLNGLKLQPLLKAAVQPNMGQTVAEAAADAGVDAAGGVENQNAAKDPENIDPLWNKLCRIPDLARPIALQAQSWARPLMTV